MWGNNPIATEDSTLNAGRKYALDCCGAQNEIIFLSKDVTSVLNLIEPLSQVKRYALGLVFTPKVIGVIIAFYYLHSTLYFTKWFHIQMCPHECPRK